MGSLLEGIVLTDLSTATYIHTFSTVGDVALLAQATETMESEQQNLLFLEKDELPLPLEF